MKNLRLSFVGGGNMARSMIGGLIGDGMAPQCITVGEPDPACRHELMGDFGITLFRHGGQQTKVLETRERNRKNEKG